jgi:hypothetical protein
MSKKTEQIKWINDFLNESTIVEISEIIDVINKHYKKKSKLK